MIAAQTGPQAHDNFMDCVHSAKKPHGMDPHTLVSRAKLLFSHVPWLTREDGTQAPAVTEAESRRLIVNMFPHPWVQKFRDSGVNPSRTPIPTILECMQAQQAAEAAAATLPKRNGKKQGNRSSKKRPASNDSDAEAEADADADDTEERLLKRSLPTPKPDEVCRIHKSHKWRKCICNPHRDADAPVPRNWSGQDGTQFAQPGRGTRQTNDHHSGRQPQAPANCHAAGAANCYAAGAEQPPGDSNSIPPTLNGSLMSPNAGHQHNSSLPPQPPDTWPPSCLPDRRRWQLHPGLVSRFAFASRLGMQRLLLIRRIACGRFAHQLNVIIMTIHVLSSLHGTSIQFTFALRLQSFFKILCSTPFHRWGRAGLPHPLSPIVTIVKSIAKSMPGQH